MLATDEKLRRILNIIRKAEGYQFFSDLQFLRLAESPGQNLGKLCIYYHNEWKLVQILFDPFKGENCIGYRLDCRLANRYIEHTAALDFYIQKAVARLRVYKYYTRSSYYGLTIEIRLGMNRLVSLNFMPIITDILEDIEAELEEELPWAPESGQEIEIPYEDFTIMKV